MKILKKFSTVLLVIVFTFVLTGANTAHAALAPGFLGLTSTYSVFGDAGIIGGAASTVWGDVGENAFGDGSISGRQAGTYYPAAQPLVVGDISSAYGDLAGETPTGTVDLSTPTSVGPGVYTVTASTFNQTLTLNGAGTYVFQRASDIAQTAGGTMILTGGACASDVYWRTGTQMTFAATGNIEGTIITGSAITFANSALTFKGRALAGTNVDLGGITITEPVVCAVPPATATIQVIKTVVNNNGRSKVIADFPLFVNGAHVLHGVVNTFPAGAYVVTETTDSNYVQTFSGDCAPSGNMTLAPGDNLVCTITNDDKPIPSSSGSTPSSVIPPLIDVVKVPSPLALPAGPGAVTYTYTLHNIGTVPVNNITMIDDSCSPLTLISGDINNDSKLDTTETWTYTCKTNLTKTTTNTVVATGWANGISATDIANATVVVGAPIVPPLIHVTKIPNPLALRSGAGIVTYTEKITNPGTVALSNVSLMDDKCSPMKYISGDTNGNSKLDTIETWTYTCRTNLTKTTTNTARASGQANGLTARDFAIATVVVTNVPGLPTTGFAPNNISWNIIVLAGILALLIFFYFIRRKQAN